MDIDENDCESLKCLSRGWCNKWHPEFKEEPQYETCVDCCLLCKLDFCDISDMEKYLNPIKLLVFRRKYDRSLS